MKLALFLILALLAGAFGFLNVAALSGLLPQMAFQPSWLKAAAAAYLCWWFSHFAAKELPHD